MPMIIIVTDDFQAYDQLRYQEDMQGTENKDNSRIKMKRLHNKSTPETRTLKADMPPYRVYIIMTCIWC